MATLAVRLERVHSPPVAGTIGNGAANYSVARSRAVGSKLSGPIVMRAGGGVKPNLCGRTMLEWHARLSQRAAALDPGRDLGHETLNLAPLIGGAPAAIAHDDGLETQIAYALDVVGNLREGACAALARIEWAALWLADTEGNLVCERE